MNLIATNEMFGYPSSVAEREREEREAERIEVELFFIDEEGRILLTRRSDNRKHYPGVWTPPGGRSQKGESGEEACAREIREQLSVTADMQHARLLLCKKADGILHEVFLVYQTIREEEIVPDRTKVAEVRFLLPEEADELFENTPQEMPTRREVEPFVMLECMRRRIPLGHYRHFKGNEYLVKGLALHSETLQPVVIYQAMYGPGETWVRPASMWLETVEKDGETVQRFVLLDTDI